MSIAQDLHDAFKDRERFDMADVLTRFPAMRRRSVSSTISRFKGVYFEYLASGGYKVIGERPIAQKPGRKKGAPKFKNPPVKRKVGEIIIDWMTRPIPLPFGAEGWRK